MFAVCNNHFLFWYFVICLTFTNWFLSTFSRIDDGIEHFNKLLFWSFSSCTCFLFSGIYIGLYNLSYFDEFSNLLNLNAFKNLLVCLLKAILRFFKSLNVDDGFRQFQAKKEILTLGKGLPSVERLDNSWFSLKLQKWRIVVCGNELFVVFLERTSFHLA